MNQVYAHTHPTGVHIVHTHSLSLSLTHRHSDSQTHTETNTLLTNGLIVIHYG